MAMTPHEYLSLYLALEHDIGRWERAKIKLYKLNSDDYLDGVLRATASYDSIPVKSSVQDKIGGAVSRKCDHDSGWDIAHLNTKILTAKKTMVGIVSSIDAVPSNDARQALDLRYLQGQRQKEIAATMDISESTVRRLLNQGLSWILFPSE